MERTVRGLAIPEIAEKTLYVPTMIAASSEVLSISAGTVDIINIAVAALLGVVAYFLRRLISRLDSVFDKVSSVDERLVRLEVQHDLEGLYVMTPKAMNRATPPRYDKENPNG